MIVILTHGDFVPHTNFDDDVTPSLLFSLKFNIRQKVTDAEAVYLVERCEPKWKITTLKEKGNFKFVAKEINGKSKVESVLSELGYLI